MPSKDSHEDQQLENAPKISELALIDWMKSCDGLPSFEKASDRKVFAKWWAFYQWAKSEDLLPTNPVLRELASKWRGREAVKSAPRTQRTAMKEVFGEEALPKVRSHTQKAPEVSEDPIEAAKLMVRSLEVKIDSLKSQMHSLSDSLEMSTKKLGQLKKLIETFEEEPDD